MTDDELDQLESEIPELAVKALAAAQHRARTSGLPIVVLVGRDVVRIDAHGNSVVLKTLPPRETVSVCVKRATS